MNAHASHPRAGRSPRPFLLSALLLAALLAVSAARSQPPAPPPPTTVADSSERLRLVRTGTFEVWQDTTRLGTEFYRVYMNPQGDSLIAVSDVRYSLRDRDGFITYEKSTLGVTRTLDAYPLMLRSLEEVGGRPRSVTLTFREGNALIFREIGENGRGSVVEVPPGRLYLLDPSVYEQVENLVSDFYGRGIASRLQNVIMTPRDTVLQVRLTRGPRETLTGPGGRKLKVTRVDVFDDLTLIKTWLDDEGLMVRLEAPAQKLRVLRLPPGEAEARAVGQAAKGSEAAKGAAPPRR